MKFTVESRVTQLPIDHTIVAGWTARDKASVDHHIEELAALGIAPPSKVPLYYRVSSALITQAEKIEVLGDATSGEVEPLLINHNNKIYLGLASDHTDRDLEIHSVAASKQACLKPVATELWDYETVRDHLDELILRCTIKEHGNRVTYQEGSLSSLRPLDELINGTDFIDASAMLCGTLGAIGSVRAACDYRMEIEDPVLQRSIKLNYSVRQLPIVS